MGIEVSSVLVFPPVSTEYWNHSGIAGAINSIAASPTALASTSLDRYFRLHSTFPPAEPGQQQDKKGQVLEKSYFKSIPTVVVWDQDITTEESKGSPKQTNDEDEDDDVWDGMERVEDDHGTSKRRRPLPELS